MLIVTDLMLNRVRFVLPHVLYTLGVSVLYLLVNGIYCAAAHTFIYQVLKWDGLLTAGAIVGCSFFLVLAYGLGHLIASWRDRKSGLKGPEAGLPFWQIRRPQSSLPMPL